MLHWGTMSNNVRGTMSILLMVPPYLKKNTEYNFLIYRSCCNAAN